MDQREMFQELTARRRSDARALDSYTFQGVKASVVEKYTDQAHFIYELLQNADDVEATRARFILYEDRLVFAHDGTRRFSVTDPDTEKEDQVQQTLGDINAICAIGGSSKAGGEATIGKFGMGFKAVFRYTATPRIYDPQVCFQIEQFIVPVLLLEDEPERREGETLFVLPFDQPGLPPEAAWRDIREKLYALDHPLLFLSHLRRIDFTIGDQSGRYERSALCVRRWGDLTAEKLRLVQSSRDGTLSEEQLWLFSRAPKREKGPCVGFFLDEDGRLAPKDHTAFCFFSTIEQTGLHFLVHAPFLLNESREGILAGARHNEQMVEALARLSAEALLRLKEIGQEDGRPLIDDGIFQIVPWDESPLQRAGRLSFKPIYDAIRETFQTAALLPGIGDCAAGGHAYWAAVPELARLFSDEQLAALSGDPLARWIFPSRGYAETRRSVPALYRYLATLPVGLVEEEDLLKDRQRRESIGRISAAFIEGQTVDWLCRLYRWIGERESRVELARTLPIFLDRTGKAAAAYDSNRDASLFLPAGEDSGYPTIHPNLLAREEAEKLAGQLHITAPALQDEINTKILPQYAAGAEGTPDIQLHFKKFFRYFQSCPQAEIKGFLQKLRPCAFLLCRQADGTQLAPMTAGEVYLPTDKLKTWSQHQPKTPFLDLPAYIQLAGGEEEAVREFFQALGVKDVPRIRERTLTVQEAYALQKNWKHSTADYGWTEWYLDGCEPWLAAAERDGEASRYLWGWLLGLVQAGYLRDVWDGPSIWKGCRSYFYYTYQTELFVSHQARALRERRWLVNEKGDFVSPKEVSVRTLGPGYDVSEAWELVRLLGIRDDTVQDIPALGASLGLSLAEQEQALRRFAEEKRRAAQPVPEKARAVRKVMQEMERRATAEPAGPSDELAAEPPADEGGYTASTVQISQQIRRITAKAEREIQEIARLEELRAQAAALPAYTYGWLTALLELEALSSSPASSREIDISFGQVERGAERTLLLRQPSRPIPQSMEELADIPLELHFAGQPPLSLAIEVVSVQSYTLRAKLRPNVQLDQVDLGQVCEARIVARHPVFLTEALRQAFLQLGKEQGWDERFDLRAGLCENIEFIFGPPGTGKTTHLAEKVILPLMRAGEDLRVLVLAPTNKAADVLAHRLLEIGGSAVPSWLVRFGGTADSQVEAVLRDKTFDIRRLPRNVTVTTIARFPYDFFLPETGEHLYLRRLRWDYIVIDEASMIPLANILYPLYQKAPQKFFIAGDPFQIAPITMVDLWKEESIYTLVGLRSFTDLSTMPHAYRVVPLTTQYRSVPAVGEVFSRLAYGGILEHHRQAGSGKPLPPLALPVGEVNLIRFPVRRYESIYRPKQLQRRSAYHIYSALFAFELASYLARELEGFRIGVIAPYKAQADLLDRLLSSAPLPAGTSVQAGTIHSFQGDECDIILALFNPPPYVSPNSAERLFLNKLSILNVAVSRARDRLFVLLPDGDMEDREQLTLLEELERICMDQPGCVQWRSQDVEERLLGRPDFLEENTFATSHQIVNVYGKPETRYEIRCEETAVDVQLHLPTP